MELAILEECLTCCREGRDKSFSIKSIIRRTLSPNTEIAAAKQEAGATSTEPSKFVTD
jgi:hypothetical protein